MIQPRRKTDDRIAAESARLTVSDVFEEWMSSDISKRKDGGQEVRRMMTKDVLPTIGGLGINEVRKLHVASIAAKVQKRGERIPHVVFSLTRQLMGFAVHRDYIEVDPTASIKKNKIGSPGKERDRILSDDELKELFRKLPDSGLVRINQLAIPLQISTCCRIGELLSARWADIHFDSAEWYIPESKNGKAHTVHLSTFTLQHMRQLYALSGTTEWLYPNRTWKAHLDTKTITRQIRDRQRAEGEILEGRTKKNNDSLLLQSDKGERWTPHDLRRTGASTMADLGMLPDVIDRCLNHIVQNRIRRTYLRHEYRNEMAQAWNLLGDRLEKLMESATTDG